MGSSAPAWARPDVTHTEAEAGVCVCARAASARAARVRAEYGVLSLSRVRVPAVWLRRGWRGRGCRSAPRGRTPGCGRPAA